MSSTNPVPSADTPITIKVSLSSGENRRIKLPLRELGANTFPDKLRSLLQIPSNQVVTFERYSDSASAFIKLDSSNPAVYKQLYRAAKAKLKLRIRANLSPVVASSIASPTSPAIPKPEHHLTAHCYAPPMGPEAPKDSFVDSLKQISAPQATPSLVRTPYSSTAAPVPVTVSSSKEALLESMGVAPKAVSNEDANDASKLSSYLSSREQFYAELASLSTKDSKPIYNSVHPVLIPSTSFTICCNNCDAAIPDAHYHCSKCDDGDFDLCESCYNSSIRCHGDDHWLVKRGVKNGKVTSSSTETIAPKASLAAFFESAKGPSTSEVHKEVPGAFSQEIKEVFQPVDMSRTCNSCVGQFDESNFVTCTKCEDYDLCIACHVQNHHGHHPSHAFMPASKDTTLNLLASKLLAPGRNVRHAAICDGCDKDILGVRHKCLNCPDWDYCSNCIVSAGEKHPGHRFVPLYEAIPNPSMRNQRHYGIHCDGPLCENKNTYIVGDRYKCAVCHDTDFCANCEALPTHRHNRTHPLIKFKTPVRNVSVTTLGEKENGEHSYTVGDQMPQTSSKGTETNPAAASANAATQVQTVAEVTPTEPSKVEAKAQPVIPNSELEAHFIRDTVADGTWLSQNRQFEQVWTLRNPGPHAWPVGCSVRFIGGDSMYNVDPNHPMDVKELLKTTESNATDRIIEAGEEVEFKVTMRTPEREGHAISYWRLKAADGFPFGHKLWCDVNVCRSTPFEVEPTKITDKPGKEMIFPKLDKESPVSSTHQEMLTERVTVPDAIYPGHETDTVSNTADNGQGEEDTLAEEVENLDLDDSETDDGFLTDEEYEMLVASDDEFKEAKNGKK